MNRETKAYHAIRRGAPKRAHITRIENAVSAGVPDIEMCINGKEMWCEVKSPIEPKKECTKLFGSNHKLLPSQKNWIFEHMKCGGNVFVIIATDKRWIVVDGSAVEDLNDMTVGDILLEAIWTGKQPDCSMFDAMEVFCNV